MTASAILRFEPQNGGEGRIRTCEGRARRFTVSPRWPLGYLSMAGRLSSAHREPVISSQFEGRTIQQPLKPCRSEILESWLWDSNPQPADYKSAALPIELSQQNRLKPCSCQLGRKLISQSRASNSTKPLRNLPNDHQTQSESHFGGFAAKISLRVEKGKVSEAARAARPHSRETTTNVPRTAKGFVLEGQVRRQRLFPRTLVFLVNWPLTLLK